MATNEAPDTADGEIPAESPLEDTYEVLDEDAGLTMDARGPRRDRWPNNDFY